jgi:hypothetical protein
MFSFKFVKKLNAFKIFTADSERVTFTLACVATGPVQDTGYTKMLVVQLLEENIHDNHDFKKFDKHVRQKFTNVISPFDGNKLRTKLKQSTCFTFDEKGDIPTSQSVQCSDPLLITVEATYLHHEMASPTYTLVINECIIF